MVDALNRLDQTDALVEHILGDRAKLDLHSNRGHKQSNSHAQAYPMEAETTTSTESNHHHNHEAADTESDQLDWDPEKIEIQSQDVVITDPSQSASRKSCKKLCPRRNHRFRDKARDHSTERVTGAELRKRTRCCRCRQLGHMARECQNPAPKDTHQSSAKNFFLPGDAFAQLHNLSSYMLFDGASKTVVGCNSDPKHNEFICLILGPARGLTDTGAQQPVVGSSAALRWCDRLLKRHGLVPVDVTPTNMIATCGGIGTATVVQVLDFPAGIVGVRRLFERRLETARQLARPAQA